MQLPFIIHHGAIVDLNAAGNVVVPAYLASVAKGYVVTCERSADGSEDWVAQGSLGRFSADGTIALLGLVALAETRGDSWHASDVDIAAFLKKFSEPDGD